ncbi:hypothetical protein AGMMS49965_22710 [Bacteroidia bacterium]|nr:hypothetical protein AGMMS49965_22710 [Bacteroidia bacterium]
MKKIKTYRLSLSRVFPVAHPKRGSPTGFYEKIQEGKKRHTIRANYLLWKKRIDEVNAGDAVLVVYDWTGKPYRSPTKTLFTFDKDSGIGVQKLTFFNKNLWHCFVDGFGHSTLYSKLYENDGLCNQDFTDWFRKYDLSKPMAIIHFTKFRY